MTTFTLDPTTSDAGRPGDAATILQAVQAVAPTIALRGDEIERGRRLPVDLVDTLREAGCFRLSVPRRLGGAQVKLVEHLAVVRELARADASVGWTVMIGSSAPVLLGMLPRESIDAIYADGPDVVLAGAFKPSGVASPVEGGFRASGRWAFASGCQHADWFIAHCMVDDGRMPPLRMMVVPASEVEVVDTWTTSGLCGSGSHDFTLDGVFVPDARTFSIFEEGGAEGPLGRIPELSLSALQFANVAVGIAEGAVAEVTTLATGKVPAFSDDTLAANPWFRHQLGEMDARLRAAGALLAADVASMWAIAVDGDEFSTERRARFRATAAWVTTTAASIVDAAYTAAGGSALYSSSPLQRRLRDAHAVTQHFALKPDTFTLAGAVLAGQDVDLSFL